MTDTVAAAWISVGGVVATAVTGFVMQYHVTKKVVQSEREKIVTQTSLESRHRRIEQRVECIRDLISELIVILDPETDRKTEYSTAVSLILKLQLILNRDIPVEKELNGVINDAGFALRHRVPESNLLPISDKLIQKTSELVNQYLGFH